MNDLTDRRHGLRLVIGIKTGFDPNAVLEQLYRLTPLEYSAPLAGKVDLKLYPSEFDPIADNSSDEGKAQNRRTEIVLIPDLEKILEASNKKAAENVSMR